MDLTELILQWQQKNHEKEVEQKLYLYAYEQLKQLARKEKSRCDQFDRNTFQQLTNNTTTLVNEAYLKLSQINQLDIKGKKQFYLLVSTVIRQILVDQARYNNALKRQPALEEISSTDIEDLLNLNQMLDKFHKKYPDKCEILSLKYFMGLTVKEISKLLECSQSKIEKDLKFAKAWLKNECV